MHHLTEKGMTGRGLGQEFSFASEQVCAHVGILPNLPQQRWAIFLRLMRTLQKGFFPPLECTRLHQPGCAAAQSERKQSPPESLHTTLTTVTTIQINAKENEKYYFMDADQYRHQAQATHAPFFNFLLAPVLSHH